MTGASAVALPSSHAPRASILILAHRNHQLLARCLASLERHLEPGLAEVIVLLNDASPDVVAYVRGFLRGARTVVSSVNRGFAGGCNLAATYARGEFVVLLNDDTEIEANWLGAMIDTADQCPEAGAIGSLVLYPDGTIQEAGCILTSDASVTPVGRGADPDSMSFMYRRRVEFCSGCSLLIRRTVWDQLGGLDERYYPAYYEDIDFCLRLRKTQKAVIFEPRSRVRHVGSASTDELYRHFISVRNHGRFTSRWKGYLDTLESSPLVSPAAVRRAMAKARGVTRHVLVIDRQAPDSAPNAVLELMRELTQSSVVTFSASEVRPRDPLLLGALGVETLGTRLDVHLAQSEHAYDAVVFVRSADVSHHETMVRRLQPRTVTVHAPEGLLKSAPEEWASTVRSMMRSPSEASTTFPGPGETRA